MLKIYSSGGTEEEELEVGSVTGVCNRAESGTHSGMHPQTATQSSTKATAMYLQKVSARDQFTEKDLDFIISTLATDEQEAQALLALLLDSESADLVFDDPALFQALQQDSGLSMVSSRFYLYLHLRKALKETGIDDREVADYLANMLARFSEIHRLRRAPSRIEEPIEYEIDLHKALAEANAYQRGEIHAYGGDRNLFMTGSARILPALQARSAWCAGDHLLRAGRAIALPAGKEPSPFPGVRVEQHL
jgi:hypothetical protein